MIEIEADLTPVQRLLDRLSNTCSDSQLVGALNTIGTRIVHNTQERIHRGISPDGTAFEPLAKSTLKKRRQMGRGVKPLIDTGDLVEAFISYKITEDGIVITASKAGASAVHGGTNRAGKHKNITIPPRPFMGVTDEDYDYIRKTIQSELKKAAGGGK